MAKIQDYLHFGLIYQQLDSTTQAWIEKEEDLTFRTTGKCQTSNYDKSYRTAQRQPTILEGRNL